jgi:hypothetical protein
MNHPDELLAVYVDGTASLPERAEVEAHLTFCADCREEVELARGALASLRLLPELEAPKLDRTAFGLPGQAPEPSAQETWEIGAAGAGGAEPAQRGRFVDNPSEDLAPAASMGGTPSGPGPARRRAASHWQVRTVQASLAAAAVLIVVAVFANLGSGHRASPAAGSKDSSSVQLAPEGSPTRSAQAYSAASLARLAQTLAREAQREPAHLASASPDPGGTSAPPADGVTAATVSCVYQATGLGGTLYYAQGAKYDGTDAYIGAFVTASGQRRSLLVVAVSVDGCRTLRFIRLAI